MTTLFKPMKIAKIAARTGFIVVRLCADTARIALENTLFVGAVSLHSIMVKLAYSVVSRLPFAIFYSTNSPAVLPYFFSFVMPFRVADWAKRHKIGGFVISPVAINVVDVKPFHALTHLADRLKEGFSCRLGNPFSFVFFFSCHETHISPHKGVVQA